jgi:hypothetical protein
MSQDLLLVTMAAISGSVGVIMWLSLLCENAPILTPDQHS